MKCKVLIPFVDKHTNVVYAINEIVEFNDKRIKEIQNKNNKLIEVIKEEKAEEIKEENKK